MPRGRRPSTAALTKPGAMNAIEQSLGPQNITVTGVPIDSHFAQVMVVADYRMKRLGMNLDASPVPGLTSYVQLLGGQLGLATEKRNFGPAYQKAGEVHEIANQAHHYLNH